MDSTPFSKKCKIMHDFYMDYLDSDDYGDFIRTNDLGFPAAVLSVMGAAILSDDGIRFVNDTWYALCEYLEIDYHGNFDSLDELMSYA